MQALNLKRTVGPSVFVCKLCGLFPYSELYDLSIVYAVPTLLLFVGCFVNIYYAFTFQSSKYANFMRSIYLLKYVVSNVSLAFVFFVQILVTSNVKKLFQTLDRLEDRFSSSNIPLNIRYVIPYVDMAIRTVYMAVIAYMNYAHFAASDLPPQELWCRLCGLVLPQCIINYQEVLFTTVAVYLTGHYTALTDRLFVVPTSTLIELHKNVTAVTLQLNLAYKRQNFAVVSNMLLMITLEVFLFYGFLSDPLFAYSIFGRSLLRIYELWYLVTATSTLASEAKNFDEELYKMVINDPTERLIDNEKVKVHLMSQQDIIFTGYGFFNLDYTLLHSVAFTIASYLVILFQFNYD